MVSTRRSSPWVTSDADGVPDFAMGHRPAVPAFDAEVAENWIWALSGKDGEVIHAWSGGDRFGAVLKNLGYLDGDGVDDLGTSEAIAAGSQSQVSCTHADKESGLAAHDFDLVPNPHAGNRRVRILSGQSGADLATLGGSAGINGLGVALAGGQQLTGDSTPDLLVGVTGFAWIVNGATFQPASAFRMDSLGTIHRTEVTNWVMPELPAGVEPWVEREISQPLFTGDHGLHLGHTASVLPDMDGDGLGEIVLGATLQEGQETLGKSDFYMSQVLWSSARRAPLAIASNAWCALTAGDLDANGEADLVTSTVSHYVRAWSLGSPGLLWEHASGTDGYHLGEGTSLAMISDRNGDGVPEILMGQNTSDDYAGGFGDDYGFLHILSGASGESLSMISVKSIGLGKYIDEAQVGGIDADCLGDLDGDGLEELVVQLPGLQEVHVLGGTDFKSLWSVNMAELPRISSARRAQGKDSQPESSPESRPSPGEGR